LKPSKIIIYIDTYNGSRLTFTNMLWRIATVTRATLCALSARALASVSTRRCEYVPPLREGDADEPLLTCKTAKQAAFIRISGRPDQSLSNRGFSFRSHFPIMFASRVSFFRLLHAWTPFFWKYFLEEQFV